MNNISNNCINKSNCNCQPLRTQKINRKTSFNGDNNQNPPVTVNDNNVQKFGARFYKACDELKGLFPYLTAKESAALIWDRMKTNKPNVNQSTEVNYEI